MTRETATARETALVEDPTNAGERPHPGESERAFPALIHVTLPIPSSARGVAAAGLGYGWMDDTQALDGGHRYRTTLAAAYSPLPLISFGADVEGYVDRFPDSQAGGETNFYGEPRLNAHFGVEATPALFLGLAADLRLVGAEAPSIEFGALSPSFRTLLAFELSSRVWLGSHLGFHVDRSAEAVPDPTLVSSTDRRTLGASSFDAVQWGLGSSYRLNERGTELLGELGGELLLDTDAPSITQLSAGLRHPLGRELSLMGVLDFAVNSRPLTLAPDELLPIEPRFSALVSVLWRFDHPAARPVPRPAALPPAPTPPETERTEAPPPPDPVVRSSVTGAVVDEGGRALSDVELTLLQPDLEPLVVRSFADGRFEFTSVPEGPLQLRVRTPGFDEAKLELGADDARTLEIVLRPAVPAGQLRGKVLDLRGNPLAARITITPGERELVAQPDGSFELELAPGRYTVRFQHDDFSVQWRKIQVHDRGVVILNIALIR